VGGARCVRRRLVLESVLYNGEQIALQPYGNGATGVTAVAIRDDFIIVRFKNSARDTYVYDREKPGSEHLERMKWIVRKGSGLTTYINRNVHDYAERLSSPG